jgi:hypothetical protein
MRRAGFLRFKRTLLGHPNKRMDHVTITKHMANNAPTTVGARWCRNGKTAKYLGVSVMTLWRWKHNPTLNFPCAAVINGTEHNDLNLVDAWMRDHVEQKEMTAA